MNGLNVVAISGGTGSAKLIRGMSKVIDNLTIIANVADNIWVHGLYVCPDVDTAMYTLANLIDRERGWGISGDTFNFISQMDSLGEESWFLLGDRDLATHIVRTKLLRGGKRLTEVTKILCSKFRVKHSILPVCDEHVETHIVTDEGEMHLQEFWVKRRARPDVINVLYNGIDKARATDEVINALEDADRIIICPGNPITSIRPILMVPGLMKALSNSRAMKIALSPMIGNSAYSGPAAKLMLSLGIESNSFGVAKLYSGFLDCIMIDESDDEIAGRIRELGIKCISTRTMMQDELDEERLAREMLIAEL